MGLLLPFHKLVKLGGKNGHLDLTKIKNLYFGSWSCEVVFGHFLRSNFSRGNGSYDGFLMYYIIIYEPM